MISFYVAIYLVLGGLIGQLAGMMTNRNHSVSPHNYHNTFLNH